MIDPRESTDFDPRAELKEKLNSIPLIKSLSIKCGLPYEFIEVSGLKCVQLNLPVGARSISEKVLGRMDVKMIEGWIDAAMNQDEIIKKAPKIADHENEME